MTIVAVGFADEGTMASIFAFMKGDIRIGQNRLPGLRENPNEGIVGGVENQRWNRNAFEHVGGGRARIIIRRPVEAGIVGGYLVIEITEAGNAPHTRKIKLSWEQARFRH